MLVGANDGAIDNQLFEITVVRYRLMEMPPDTLLAPPALATKHAVPCRRTVRFGWASQIATTRLVCYWTPVTGPRPESLLILGLGIPYSEWSAEK